MCWILVPLTAFLTYHVVQLRKEQAIQMATLADLQLAISDLGAGVDRIDANVDLAIAKIVELSAAHDFQPEVDTLAGTLATLNAASDAIEAVLNPPSP